MHRYMDNSFRGGGDNDMGTFLTSSDEEREIVLIPLLDKGGDRDGSDPVDGIFCIVVMQIGSSLFPFVLLISVT